MVRFVLSGQSVLTGLVRDHHLVCLMRPPTHPSRSCTLQPSNGHRRKAAPFLCSPVRTRLDRIARSACRCVQAGTSPTDSLKEGKRSEGEGREKRKNGGGHIEGTRKKEKREMVMMSGWCWNRRGRRDKMKMQMHRTTKRSG